MEAPTSEASCSTPVRVVRSLQTLLLS